MLQRRRTSGAGIDNHLDGFSARRRLTRRAASRSRIRRAGFDQGATVTSSEHLRFRRAKRVFERDRLRRLAATSRSTPA
jgi:hypothetical protein